MSLFVLCSKVSSQKIERTIIIKDSETNLPIEDASVLILKTRQILFSNSEGKVTFMLNGASNVQVTHSSYISTSVRWLALKKNENVVYLKSNLSKLDEIVVTKQHPQKILQSLVDNSFKKLNVPASLKVYSREFFKVDGVYSYYNDGLLNFQLLGKQKKFNTDLLVEQNRSFGVLEQEMSADLLGYNLNNIMQNYYSFKYLKPILEPKASKEYSFMIKAYTENDQYYVMTASPIDGAVGLLDDFKIIYDPIKKMIIEVSSVISPNSIAQAKEKSIFGSRKTTKSSFKATYRIDMDNYYLVSSKEEIGFDMVLKDRTKSIEVRNYFVTTNFNNQNFTYNKRDVFKDKTLFNKRNTILTNYWNVSGLTATAEEQDIVDKIEKKI